LYIGFRSDDGPERDGGGCGFTTGNESVEETHAT